MRLLNKQLLEVKWIQEVLVFIILFILVTLNAWHYIKSLEDLTKAVVYFLILYAHMQLHRVFLLPLFFRKGRYVLYAVFTIVLLLLFSFILYLTDFYWIYYWVQANRINKPEIYFYHTGTCALSLIAMLSPFVLLSYYQEQKKQAGLINSVSQMQLKNLHAQLNPHFLFNTFNNLYGISLNDPARVPDLILQVSKLMRYQLEGGAGEWVKLEDELDFIEGYIELEEERVGNRCDIKYEYGREGGSETYYITPLLLISFIENAFKHGTNSIANSFVYINVFVKKLALEMEVINSIPFNKNTSNPSMGIGIKNAIQRLDILYGGKYELTMEPGNDEYRVRLVLPLTVSKHAEQNKMPDS